MRRGLLIAILVAVHVGLLGAAGILGRTIGLSPRSLPDLIRYLAATRSVLFALVAAASIACFVIAAIMVARRGKNLAVPMLTLVLVGVVGFGVGYTQGSELIAPTPTELALSRACQPVDPASAGPVQPIASPSPVGLELVATADVPTTMAFDPLGRAVLVGQRAGRVLVLADQGLGNTVLDLSADTSVEGEQGLVSLAFDPGGDWLYVDRTNREGTTLISAFRVEGGLPQPGTEEVILEVDQPTPFHNGGGLGFGADGTLYVGMGDGGKQGDPDDNAQSMDTLLGKILRIQPRPGQQPSYLVPNDNPFVGQPRARPEIYAIGLRNPFRLSFDRASGDLWLGDVGQLCREEIDVIEAGSGGGQNFGWNLMEGTHAFAGRDFEGHDSPRYEYDHTEDRCGVLAGFVYRGQALDLPAAAYLFSDICSGKVRALVGDGESVAVIEEDPGILRPVALVEDLDGEPWLVSFGGEIYRLVPSSP